jgi:hypothetical protein
MPDDEQDMDGEVEVSKLPQTATEPVAPAEEADINLEDAFQGLFKTSASGSGEEELLRIASTYSRQITTRQIKALLYIEWVANHTLTTPENKRQLLHFVDRWLELKQYNNSDQFVMRALDSISLRKFIGENAFKVNIEK